MEALKSTGVKSENKQFFAKHCAMLATRAALYEVVAAPKPGLVDRLDRGAHQDMDLFTFIDSATALTPYFETFFRLGHTEKTGYEHLFSQLRKAGREAEKAMFSATRGINTHKGLIFLMAIFCGGLGYQWIENGPIISQAALRGACAEIGRFSLADFEAPDMTGTAGGICYERHGVAGIRGEVCSGFSTVFETGLPALYRSLAACYSFEESCCAALLHIMAQTCDTNMIKRGGFDLAQQERRQIQATLAYLTPQTLTDTLSGMNRAYIAKGLSPGGCADLLAITIFSYFLEREGFMQGKAEPFLSPI